MGIFDGLGRRGIIEDESHLIESLQYGIIESGESTTTVNFRVASLSKEILHNLQSASFGRPNQGSFSS
jgi:hypothetical protein